MVPPLGVKEANGVEHKSISPCKSCFKDMPVGGHAANSSGTYEVANGKSRQPRVRGHIPQDMLSIEKRGSGKVALSSGSTWWVMCIEGDYLVCQASAMGSMQSLHI